MKRIIILLLSALCLFAFVACDEKTTSGSGSPSGNPDEEAATKVAKAFLESFIRLDIRTLSQYTDDLDYFLMEEDAYDETEKIVVSQMMECVPSSLKSYRDELNSLAKLLFRKCVDTLSYRITDCEATGPDEYTFSFDYIGWDIDFAELFEETVLAEFSEEAQLAMIEELFDSGRVNDMYEWELPELLTSALVEAAENAIRDLQFETETIPGDPFVVVKSGNRWLVSAEKTEALS